MSENWWDVPYDPDVVPSLYRMLYGKDAEKQMQIARIKRNILLGDEASPVSRTDPTEGQV